MPTPYLVADAAQVTVLRSLASTAFGRYDLKPPEGVDVEEIYPPSAPDNEVAYVSALNPKRRVGGMFRRFVRADVKIQAPDDEEDSARSNVEEVLDEVANRTSGDFFLESDISRAGLGPWVPFVDFNVGDMANVEIWGRVVRLPVVRINPKDWSVHVGGQIISDRDALLAQNAEIHDALIDDQRDLAGLDRRVRSESSARRRADTRITGQLGELRQEFLDYSEETTRRLKEQSGRIDDASNSVDQATRDVVKFWSPENQNKFNQTVQLFTAATRGYVDVNDIKWTTQDEWNRRMQEQSDLQQQQMNLQQEYARVTRQLAEANQRASDANARALRVEKEYRRRLPRLVFAKFSDYKNMYRDSENFVRLEAYGPGDRGFKITALGSWTGDMVVRATAIGPLSANSIDSVRARVTRGSRVFNGVPEVAQMSYNTLDITIYPD